MTYFHMGKPHTIIGAEWFHFWVRYGIRWYTFAIITKQKPEWKLYTFVMIIVSTLSREINIPYGKPWDIYFNPRYLRSSRSQELGLWNNNLILAASREKSSS